jgi:hypothetical protein
MSGPTAKNTASGDTQAAAEALTLLDALARLPAAAALVRALERAEDRLAAPRAPPDARRGQRGDHGAAGFSHARCMWLSQIRNRAKTETGCNISH